MALPTLEIRGPIEDEQYSFAIFPKVAKPQETMKGELSAPASLRFHDYQWDLVSYFPPIKTGFPR